MLTQSRLLLPVLQGSDIRPAGHLGQHRGVPKLVSSDAVQLHLLMELVGLAADDDWLAGDAGHHGHSCRACPGHDCAIRQHG